MRRVTTRDIEVANRIREVRLLSGISQEKIGLALGITFQQVQKYERGVNRVSAGRLVQIASVLRVDAAYLFMGDEKARPGGGIMSDAEAQMLRNLLSLPAVQRRAFFALIESSAAAELSETPPELEAAASG